MQNDTFRLKINCVVLTTNLALGKKFVLSLDKDLITLPSFDLKAETIASNTLESYIVENLKKYIFVNDLELLPQLITLHSNNIKRDNQDTINTVYASLVNYSNSLNNAYWIEFDYLQPNEYTPVLIEVIQQLK